MDEMNSYIECTECGHPLERHGLQGCDWQADGCSCTARWTKHEIRAQRKAAGLPQNFKAHDF